MSSVIVLLSGGLDSLVALDIASKKYDKIHALFFNYNQKAYFEELEAVKKIVEKYSITYEEIKLDFLVKITNNALTNEENTDLNNLKSVWIANRNGLFLNIAASYCDALDYDHIVFGANKEESKDFSDNRSGFIDIANEFFEYSTLKKPQVIAPCCKMSKVDLVNYMINNNISFSLIKSCYQNIKTTSKKHCSECMSCKLLYNAVINSKKPELIKEIF